MRDKDLSEIAATLFPLARHLVFTRASNPRAAASEMLALLAPPDFDAGRLTMTDSPAEALSVALSLTPPGGLICVTGSLYLIGDIMQVIDSEPAAGG